MTVVTLLNQLLSRYNFFGSIVRAAVVSEPIYEYLAYFLPGPVKGKTFTPKLGIHKNYFLSACTQKSNSGQLCGGSKPTYLDRYYGFLATDTQTPHTAAALVLV